MREEMAVRLIEERGRLGYSQSGLARQLEISHEGLRRYEMGQRGISVEFLAKAATLGLDVQYILTGVRSANLNKVAPPKMPNLREAMKSLTITDAMRSLTITDALKPSKETAKAVEALSNVVPLKKSRSIKTTNSDVVQQLVGGNISGGSVNVGGNVTMISTPKHVTRTVAEVKPGEAHITDEQAARLTALVRLIVEWEAKVKKKPNGYRGVWAGLNAHCRVTKYRLIALDDYDKAEKYLHQWLGRLQSMASAPVADNDTWRKRRYAYIKINTRETEAWLLAYLRKNFKTESLTDLSDAELDRTYRAVAGRKRRN